MNMPRPVRWSLRLLTLVVVLFGSGCGDPEAASIARGPDDATISRLVAEGFADQQVAARVLDNNTIRRADTYTPGGIRAVVVTRLPSSDGVHYPVVARIVGSITVVRAPSVTIPELKPKATPQEIAARDAKIPQLIEEARKNQPPETRTQKIEVSTKRTLQFRAEGGGWSLVTLAPAGP